MSKVAKIFKNPVVIVGLILFCIGITLIILGFVRKASINTYAIGTITKIVKNDDFFARKNDFYFEYVYKMKTYTGSFSGSDIVKSVNGTTMFASDLHVGSQIRVFVNSNNPAKYAIEQNFFEEKSYIPLFFFGGFFLFSGFMTTTIGTLSAFQSPSSTIDIDVTGYDGSVPLVEDENVKSNDKEFVSTNKKYVCPYCNSKYDDDLGACPYCGGSK